MLNYFGQVKVEGVPLKVHTAMYANKRLAVVVTTNSGEPWARLSVNLPNANIQRGEFAFDAPKHSEVARDYLKSGFFRETGRYEMSGYCCYPIWELQTAPSE